MSSRKSKPKQVWRVKSTNTLNIFENLDEYTQLEILDKMDYNSLRILCQTSTYFRSLCGMKYVKDILEKKKKKAMQDFISLKTDILDKINKTNSKDKKIKLIKILFDDYVKNKYLVPPSGQDTIKMKIVEFAYEDKVRFDEQYKALFNRDLPKGKELEDLYKKMTAKQVK